MSGRRDNATILGVGAAACVACCAGPILALLGAIGLGTVLGVLLFGAAGLTVAAIGAVILIPRRRRRQACEISDAPVPVEMPKVRTPT